MERNNRFPPDYDEKKWDWLVDVISVDIKHKVRNIIEWTKNWKIQQLSQKEYLVEFEWLLYYVTFDDSVYYSDEKCYAEWNELRIHSHFIIEEYKLGKLPAIWLLYVNKDNKIKSVYYDKNNHFRDDNSISAELWKRVVNKINQN